MIAFVNGIVKIIRNDRVVLDVHGVGYEVYLANALSQKMNEELFLYTYQHVREDAILLFGFIKEEDYEVFMRLINVKRNWSKNSPDHVIGMFWKRND